MPIPSWVTQWVQARDDELLYNAECPPPEAWAASPVPSGLPVLRSRGYTMIRHAVLLSLPCVDVSVDGPAPMCESVYPARRCACGLYALVWE